VPDSATDLERGGVVSVDLALVSSRGVHVRSSTRFSDRRTLWSLAWSGMALDACLTPSPLKVRLFRKLTELLVVADGDVALPPYSRWVLATM